MALSPQCCLFDKTGQHPQSQKWRVNYSKYWRVCSDWLKMSFRGFGGKFALGKKFKWEHATAVEILIQHNFLFLSSRPGSLWECVSYNTLHLFLWQGTAPSQGSLVQIHLVLITMWSWKLLLIAEDGVMWNWLIIHYRSLRENIFFF